jgi:hypothetical protein
MNRNKTFTEFRNIRVTNDGYQVVITRAKIEVSKLFAGHNSKSLRAAEKYRNQLLKDLPNKRLNMVPRRVLPALGHSKPVVGVFRHPKRKHYSVGYGEDGRHRSKSIPVSHQ